VSDRLVLLAVIGLAGLSCATYNVDGTSATSQPAQSRKAEDRLPEVSVDLLGPITSLKGSAWPRGYDWVHKQSDQPLPMAAVEQPHQLLVHLPSGRTLSHASKVTFLTKDADRAIIKFITLTPSMRLLRFQDAVSELQRLLSRWDCIPTPVSARRIDEWKKEGDLQPDPVASFSGAAEIRGDKDLELFFEIRPGDGGWFISLTLGPGVDSIVPPVEHKEGANAQSQPAGGVRGRG